MKLDNSNEESFQRTDSLSSTKKNLKTMITEPMTITTDYILASIALMNWLKLQKYDSHLVWYWKNSFLFLGLAAITGGTSHGFYKILNGNLIYLLTIISFHLVATTNLFFFLGSLNWKHLNLGGFKTHLQLFAILKFLLIEILVIINAEFIIIAIDLGITFIFIILIRSSIWVSMIPTEQDQKLLYLALTILILAGIVWFNKLSFATWFNQNDIGHILLMIFTYLIYQVVLQTESE